MSSSSKPSPLSEEIAKLKAAKQEAKKPGRGSGHLAMADQLLTTLPFKLVTSTDTDEEESVLYTQSDDGVLEPYPNKKLDAQIFLAFPELVKAERDEVARFVKVRTYTTNTIDLSTVCPVAFADEEELLTWNRLPLKRAELHGIGLEDLPEFEHIVKLCDDGRALVLWIGSLLDSYSGRTQYLHLHGGGGNGKSTLFNGIATVLGDRHVIRTRADEFQNQHWGANVEGARLLIFPDENNAGFFSTSKFKEYTGEDAVTVNPKYEKPRTIRLTHKTAIFSNNRVEISSNAADRRRLLSISMTDDPDPNVGFRWWYDGLKSSGDRILAYCFREYEKAVLADPAIRAFIPQQKEAIDAAIERKYSEITDTVLEHYAVTGSEEHAVNRATLHEKIAAAMRERRRDRVFLQQLKEALLRLGVTEARAHGGRAVYKGIQEVSSHADGRPRLPVIKGGKS